MKMNPEFETRIKAFAVIVEEQQIARLHEQELACQSNINNAKTVVVPGNKYTKVNVGGSGRFMVEISTGNIFGTKGYGQIHKGHFYGTLDTVNDYNWGDYYPVKKVGNCLQKANGCPIITKAPIATLLEQDMTYTLPCTD